MTIKNSQYASLKDLVKRPLGSVKQVVSRRCFTLSLGGWVGGLMAKTSDWRLSVAGSNPGHDWLFLG